jgi:ribosomal 50S subunit-recycling heat shock protein
VAFIAAAEIAAGRVAEEKARHGIAADVVAGVRIALRVGTREIEIAVVIARRLRRGGSSEAEVGHVDQRPHAML